jgi:acetyl-CoA C-acetyltransferase
MTEAFIYDHVRSPRGRGKADGSLHEVTTLNLATQVLAGLRERNALDPELVDDVVLGCVDPVGEAGCARVMAMACRGCRSTASARPALTR